MKTGITKSGSSTEDNLISLVPSAKDNPDKSWLGSRPREINNSHL